MEQSAFLTPAMAIDWSQIIILVLPLPLLISSNLAERRREHDQEQDRRRASGSGAATRPAGADEFAPPPILRVAPLAPRDFWWLLSWLALGGVCGATVVLGLLTLTASTLSTGTGSVATYGTLLIVTGIVAGSTLLAPTRRLLARVLPVDPSNVVHATAIVLSIVLVGMQIATQLSVDLLAQQAQNGVALDPLDLVLQELPFLLAAFLGVGFVIRRPAGPSLVRLGLVRPTLWQVLLALAAAGVFYAFGTGMDVLGHTFTAGIAHKVDAANQRLFGQLDDPVGIATIALSAGICEEALFRGALQPRLGMLWTSLVFAAVHTQYGLSLDTVAVFILAIGLAALRRFANTTTSTICHVVYNALVGVGVTGALIVPALVIEAALLLTGVAGLFTGRLGRLRTAQ